jgi:hypothetical protein
MSKRMEDERLERVSYRLNPADIKRADELRINVPQLFRLTLKRAILVKEMELQARARAMRSHRAPGEPSQPASPSPKDG